MIRGRGQLSMAWEKESFLLSLQQKWKGLGKGRVIPEGSQVVTRGSRGGGQLARWLGWGMNTMGREGPAQLAGELLLCTACPPSWLEQGQSVTLAVSRSEHSKGQQRSSCWGFFLYEAGGFCSPSQPWS